MNNRTEEEEKLNKEFMEHLDREIPYDKEASKIAGEKRAKERTEELRKKNEK